MLARSHLVRGCRPSALVLAISALCIPSRAPATVPVPADFQVDVPWSTAGIVALATAPDGSLWAAGQTGLMHFDGRDVVTFDSRAITGLTGGGQVGRIAIDPAGTVWVGMGAGFPYANGDGGIGLEGKPLPGLRQLRNRTWSVGGTEEGMSGTAIWALLAHDGALWVGLSGGVGLLRDGRLGRFEAGAGLPATPVTVLAADGPGAVLVGGPGGLGRLAGGKYQHLLGEPVFAALRASGGRLWVGTTRGLVALDDGKAAVRLTRAEGLAGDEVRALASDREALWVGTYSGLSRIEGQRIETFRAADGLPDDRITALAIDREAGVWLGTRSAGLARLSRAVITGISTRNGLPADHVRGVVQDAKGTVWILTAGGLSRVAGGHVSSLRTGTELPDTDLRTLAVAPGGDVWIGTRGSGLVRRAPDGQLQTIGEKQGLPTDHVFTVLAARDGRLWTSGPDRQLIRWQVRAQGPMVALDALERHDLPERCVGPLVGGYEGPAGTLYFFPQRRGLIRVAAGRVACLTEDEGMPDRQITSAWEDVDGTVWLGAFPDGGILRARAGRVHRFDERSGLPCDSITGIVGDGSGHLWLSCSAGASRVDIAELDAVLDGRLDRVRPLRFGVANGMRNQESGPGMGPAAALGLDGALWVATLGGVAVIRPPELVSVPVPSLSFVGATVDERPVALPVRVRADVIDLAIAFRSVTFSFPGATRFRYRLLGLEHSWTESVDRQVRYPRLPPGTYSVEIQASNAWGSWGESALTASLTVMPPFHRTPWFGAGAVLGVATLLVGAHRLRMRRVQARFALVQAERERIARDLHDGLGQGFTSVGFHLEALAEHMRGQPNAPMALLARTREVLDRCREEARRTVWSLRDDTLRGRSLPAALAALADEPAVAGAPEVEVVVTGSPPRRDAFLEHELYRMALELVTNARRHARASHVVLDLEWRDDEVVLRVKDDGRGLVGQPADHAARGHFGLMGIQERARWLGGSVAIMTGPEIGTEVRVGVPLRQGNP